MRNSKWETKFFGLDFFFGTICRNTLTLSETRLVLEGVTIDQKPLNDSKNHIHPLQRIAKFHLDFEGIHPFIDGNGRTGRLLLNFALMRAGYLPIDIKFTDRRRYYAAFEAYYAQGEISPMVELVTGYEDEALGERLAILAM